MPSLFTLPSFKEQKTKNQTLHLGMRLYMCNRRTRDIVTPEMYENDASVERRAQFCIPYSSKLSNFLELLGHLLCRKERCGFLVPSTVFCPLFWHRSLCLHRWMIAHDRRHRLEKAFNRRKTASPFYIFLLLLVCKINLRALFTMSCGW